MRVLHINTYDSAGGAEKIAYTLYKQQANSTFLVKRKLKYFDDENILQFESLGLDKAFALLDKVVWKLGYKKQFRTLIQAGDEFNLTYKKLKALKAYQNADVIHLHNIHGYYFDLKAIGSIAEEKKIIWTVHDMWPITGGDAHLYDNQFNFNEHLNNKILFNQYPLNGPLIDRRNQFLNYKREVYRKFANKIYFVPVSNWLKNSIRNSAVYNENMQIEVIYNGIDISKYKNLHNRYWSVPRVLFFNSDNPFKGSDLFIQNINKVITNFELYVVGGAIQRPINPNIKIIQLDKTTDEEQLSSYFNNVDILVFPSTAESFGLLPAEAMLCGVLVISSDAGGLKELVIEDITGKLFENGNAEDLINKLEQVLNNLEIARTIGANSSEYVKQNFNLAKMIFSYEQLYEKVLHD